MQNNPIIITGMHRSGTSLITRALWYSGVFLPPPLDQNLETKWMISINDHLLKVFQGSWDSPDTYIRNVKRKELFEIRYKNFLVEMAYNHLTPLDNMRWCWKDPRTTLTIPFWDKFFPESKILFIIRNPIDVAISLKERHKNDFNYNNCPSYYNFSDINEGILLWQKYNTFFLQYYPEIENKCMFIKIEDFMDSSIDVINKICSFLEHDISNTEIDQLANLVDKSKKYAFLSSDKKDIYMKMYNNLCCNDEIMKYFKYKAI